MVVPAIFKTVSGQDVFNFTACIALDSFVQAACRHPTPMIYAKPRPEKQLERRMLIHLMQHGACLSKELDPHQPLSPVGREQAIKSARAMRTLGLRFQLVVASPKLRSLQTAESHGRTYRVSRGGGIEVTEAIKGHGPHGNNHGFHPGI